MHGCDDVKDQARVFGHVYFRATEEDDTEAELLYDLLGERGIEIADGAKASYSLRDLAALPEQVSSAITKMHAAGVPPVLPQGDPYGPSLVLADATAQHYDPEWVEAARPPFTPTDFGS